MARLASPKESEAGGNLKRCSARIRVFDLSLARVRAREGEPGRTRVNSPLDPRRGLRSALMPDESVGQLVCAECGCVSTPEARGWHAYLDSDGDVQTFCDSCAEA